jgi:hypothetical protein
VVTATVHSRGDGIVAVYLDDIIVTGRTWAEVWDRTLEVLRRLVGAGFMINANKCNFLTHKLMVVGHEVANGSYKPREKKLLVLFS